MKLEQTVPSFREELCISPLPSSRPGSASVNLDMSDNESDEYGDVNGVTLNDDGRLSRSLQTWMTSHEWSTVQPLEKPPREPLFSGKLGNEAKVVKRKRANPEYTSTKVNGTPRAKIAPLRRVPSDDSIHTSLSLLTCSSIETEKEPEIIRVKKKRKKRGASRASNGEDENQNKSIWVEFANKQNGKKLNRLFRTHAALANDIGIHVIGGGEFSEETEAFRMLAQDEQTSLFNSGMTKGVKYVDKMKLKRSASLSKLGDEVMHHYRDNKDSKVKRVLSASAKRPFGKVVPLEDLKREHLTQVMAIEQERQRQERERQRRNSRRLTLSRKSSARSSVGEFQQRISVSSPTNTNVGSASANSPRSVQSSDLFIEVHQVSPNDKEECRESGTTEEQVSVWKGDREILEIDLRRELTQHVKQKISTTRLALKRVTGMGEDNGQKQTVGRLDEFPKHVQDDFCHKPRIVQKMRISPHLSGVIHDDIQIRMGRPRYHEIREVDLEQWNKGQPLNRAHRNLKVFNWLNSLRDYNIKGFIVPEITDDVDDDDLADNFETLHVEAADEPDVKPLYRQYEVRML